VLTAPIGIGVKGGGLKRVLEKDTRLPAEKTIAVPIEAGQDLAIAVFQGTSGVAEENEYLGALHTSSDRKGELTLQFTVSVDGRLDMTAAAPGGKKCAVTLTTADASDDTRAALFAQAPLPPPPSNPPPGGLLRGLKKLFSRGS
jgi:hypothetical protein